MAEGVSEQSKLHTLRAGVPDVDLWLQAVNCGRRVRRQCREQPALQAQIELGQLLHQGGWEKRLSACSLSAWDMVVPVRSRV